MIAPNSNDFAVTSWGQQNAPFEVVTPSGQKCLLRKLDMEDILSSGIINDLDSFSSALLAEDGDEAKAQDPKELMKAFSDKEKFKKMIETMDKVLVLTVVLPEIVPVPAEGVAREVGKAYIDQVNLADKMFIFSKVNDIFGGLETFREEQEAGLGNLENEQSLPSPTESAPGTTA